ncbi:MAG: hypothetical protein GX621_18510 [Pirellulaceae bacterium]|nr:hypothetical protein [Pirellulaceae bacterium]
MKKSPLLILLCVGLLAPAATYVGCVRGVDFQTAAELTKAQEAFDRADSPDEFLKVAAMYQAARDRGLVSGAVLYNQGNALMKAGQTGRAIAAYREATRYRPVDPYLKANLDYALGSRAEPAARRPMIEYLLFWQNWIGYPAKFRLAGAAVLATFLVASAGWFVWRRTLNRVALAGLAVSAVLSLSAAYDWHRFDYQQHGVVVANETIARLGYAQSYEPAFTEPLTEGTEFTVLDRRGDWVFVSLPGDANREGWIEAKTAVLY